MANLQQIQFTLEDLLVVKLIIKERPCLQKKKKVYFSASGKAENIDNPHYYCSVLLPFPEMNNSSCVCCKESRWDSSLLWIGRCITDKICLSAIFQRQCCNLLKDKNPSSNDLFSTASVFFHSHSLDVVPKKVLWRVKSENPFIPADFISY